MQRWLLWAACSSLFLLFLWHYRFHYQQHSLHPRSDVKHFFVAYQDALCGERRMKQRDSQCLTRNSERFFTNLRTSGFSSTTASSFKSCGQ